MTAEELISREKLQALPEYSITVPTGVTIGKRWRKATVVARLDPRETTEWLIGTYVESSKEGYADVAWVWAVEAPGVPHRTARWGPARLRWAEELESV